MHGSGRMQPIHLEPGEWGDFAGSLGGAPG